MSQGTAKPRTAKANGRSLLPSRSREGAFPDDRTLANAVSPQLLRAHGQIHTSCAPRVTMCASLGEEGNEHMLGPCPREAIGQQVEKKKKFNAK